MPPDETAREVRPADVLERAFAFVVTVIVSVSWVGIVAAEAGVFRPWPLAIGSALTLGVALWHLLRWLRRDSAPSFHLAPLAWTSCLVATGVLTLTPPADPLVAGADESVYLNLGQHLVNRGGLIAT